VSNIQDRWKTKDGQATGRANSGKRYRVRYLDPDSKWKSKSFQRLADAQQFEANVNADILKGSYVDPGAGRVSFRAYADEWFAMRTFKTATTRDTVRRHLEGHIYPGLGGYALYRLRPSVIQSWAAGLVSGSGNGGRPLAARYVRQMMTLLSSILDAAVEDKCIASNPCRSKTVKVEVPREPKIIPWTTAQVAAVRAALPEQYQAACYIGANLGLRQGEVFALSPSDIDWLRNKIHVRRQLIAVRGRPCFAPPKGGRDRDLPLPESVKLRLSAHLERFPAKPVTLPWMNPDGKSRTEQLFFTSKTDRAVRRSTFDQYFWVPAVEAAGMTPGHPNGFHALRHYFASALIEAGVSIKEVAEHLGHHDAAFTLKVYAHVMPGSGERMRRAIDSLLNGESADPEKAREIR
jgi:integrase